MPGSARRALAGRPGPFRVGDPVWAEHPDGPRYGQPRWDCEPLARVNQAERYIDLEQIPEPYRADSQDLLAVLARPDPPAVVDAGVVRRGQPAPLGTVYEHYLRLRTLARWGLQRRPEGFRDWTQQDADDLLEDLRHGRHREEGVGVAAGTLRGYVEVLKLLRECAPALPGGLSFLPWGPRTAADVADYQKPGENLIPPLPWDTWAPAVAASWAFVDRFSADIVAAVETARALPAVPTGPGRSNGWRVLQAWSRDGGLLPLHTGFGRSPGRRGEPNVRLLCRLLGIHDSFLKPNHHNHLPAATGLVQAMAEDPSRSALGGLVTPSVTVTRQDGTTGPWVAEIGLGETEYLLSALRAACYVILGSLTGMRDSELQELTRDAATVRDGLPALDSVQHKGNDAPDGVERGWWAPEPALRAVDVLARLSEHPTHLLARTADNAGAYDASRDIARLVALVNEDPAVRPGRGGGLGLKRIDLEGVDSINAATLRRSLSVYATTHAGAELGLGIQLGHAAWRMTTAYAGDSQQRAVRHIDAARVAIVREQAAELVRGTGRVAGTPAGQVAAFRAQVIADPARADRIEETVADRLHLGVVNDCMFDGLHAACDPVRPRLGDHLCVGADCGNALFRVVHLPVLKDTVARIDAHLDRPGGSPALREQHARNRAGLVRLVRQLQQPDDLPDDRHEDPALTDTPATEA